MLKKIAASFIGMMLALAVSSPSLATDSGQKAAGEGGGEAKAFTLSSSAFPEKGRIPQKYGCGPKRDYRKASIPVAWKNPPAGTGSFILLMDDPHPVAKNWVHWLVIDIPAKTSSLAEGASGAAMPKGARELKNSWGCSGYGGPCPPKGRHTYRLQLFAMPSEKTAIDLGGMRGDAVAKALKGALGLATLAAVFP